MIREREKGEHSILFRGALRCRENSNSRGLLSAEEMKWTVSLMSENYHRFPDGKRKKDPGDSNHKGKIRSHFLPSGEREGLIC